MDKHWMAIYTKPRSEKKVAERLQKLGVEVYCPLKITLRQWSDRKKKVKVPVFPSYVFVRVAEADRYQVLQDPGVTNFVYWLGKPATIRDEEIIQLKTFLEGNPQAELLLEQLSVGDLVTIKQGVFSGKVGRVDAVEKNKVVLLIESLGMVVRASMHPGWLA